MTFCGWIVLKYGASMGDIYCFYAICKKSVTFPATAFCVQSTAVGVKRLIIYEVAGGRVSGFLQTKSSTCSTRGGGGDYQLSPQGEPMLI